MADDGYRTTRIWAAVVIVLGLAVAAALTFGDGRQAESNPAATVTVTAAPNTGTGAGSGGGTATAQPTPEATVDPAEQAAREQWMLSLPRRVEGDPLAKGQVDAPVVMTEWGDYRCPFCNLFGQQTLPLLQPLVDDGTLRIEFRDFAIFGDDSVNAAAAGRAAGEQGLFWEYQAALFAALPTEGHPPVGDELVEQVANEVGVPDLERFMADYRSEEIRGAVAASTAEAQQLGISSTPTFLVGTEIVSGAQTIEYFEAIIAQQLAQHG